MISSTSLLIPPVRKVLVSRPRLTRKLEDGMETKLTLLSAQAGYGKTTALSEWARQCQHPVAWISLDKYDNDWSAFWSCVFASIREKVPRFGESIEYMLEQASAASIDSAVLAFLNELHSIKGDFVLILDDYHVIENATVNESIRYMLAHLPTHVHLYIASRTELLFPTARLLAKGEINIIRVEDMRFELEEGYVFFKETTDLLLTEKQVAELFHQTEGWVSGLQLAAISLKRSGNIADSISQFNGRQRHISDYLLEEVFEHLPVSLREFLLATSVLNRMNWEMCLAVTGKNDSQEQLEQLEQLNLFIVPLDDQRNWFRYHHLLSEFLQQLSAREHTELWRQSHQRAAVWHENEGLYEEAMEHYIKAQQSNDAVRLIDRLLPDLMLAKGSVLVRWITSLPESSYEHMPTFELFYISNLLMEGEWRQGLHRAEQAEKRFEAMRAFIPEPAFNQLMGNLYYLCGIFSYLQQDLPLTSKYFELSELHLPEASSFQKISSKRYQGHEGFMDLLSLSNNLHEVELFLLKWIKTWEKKKNYPFVGYHYLSYCLLLYEWNRLEEAELYLEQAMNREDLRTNVWIWIHIGLASFWVQRALGKESQAMEWLNDLGSNVDSPDQQAIWKRIKAEQAQLLLSQGQPQQACEWLEQSGMSYADEVTPRYFEEYLIMVRILAANKRIEEAKQLLEQLERLADKENRLRGRIKLKILQSIVLWQSDYPKEAFVPLEMALRLSEPAGYIRSFLDEGPLMVEMLSQLVKEQQEAAKPRMPLKYTHQILEAANSGQPYKTLSNEALTEQEEKVLVLLTEGFIYKEIAVRLNITLDTVKFHMKNVYRKLGVSNRTQAIQRVKQHRLLN
ncbi:LuxR family maltose regulon positive regulatory protein [Paenibacillus endophyticus]|uniref:LuxR family maltose regulon positive regulatory protein n=1 Tax=Paenibacillus endophyticus TaxID=1294268 RepID=A0A7W5C824_9BACL|nr:LuxR C-terminal-related transcriptional regulator [Paenibacillus endophyticus]MBB3152848.1 LuxR family maltose regulon positive regulatory protein [Paenibacillus endophyticus]